MKIYLKRFFSIVSLNTLVALSLAITSMMLSIHYDLKIDFPLTIIGIAVVFPIVFSIGGAYKRREVALQQYAIMKAMGRSMYFASRDWLRDSGKKAEKNKQEFKETLEDILELIIHFFKVDRKKHLPEEEQDIYEEFSKLSKVIEGLRDRGMSGSEVSRLNSFLNKFLIAFETSKHIYQYRTPRTLRLYSKFFIYCILIVLGPYFALLVEGQNFWIGLSVPVLFAMVLTGLDNIQDHLENPFDGLGEDDIKINPEKFVKTLEE